MEPVVWLRFSVFFMKTQDGACELKQLVRPATALSLPCKGAAGVTSFPCALPSLCLLCNSVSALEGRRVLLSVPSGVFFFFLVSVLTEVFRENPATLFVSYFFCCFKLM